MAECRESPEYSSPPKRLKLDLTSDENSSLSAEVLACSDSGFSDFPTSSASTSTEETNQTGSLSLPCPNPDQTQDETMENEVEENGEEDNDDVSSTVSDLSDLSGLSDASDSKWRPQMAGTMAWVQKQINQGIDPREVLQKMGNLLSHIPMSLDDTTLWKIIVSVLSEPPRREKLSYINTVTDVVRLMKEAKNIVVLTGAGVSVSCGIPDFRSRDGIYSRLAIDFPDLPDPQAMFDINYFRQDPRPFYKFAREIYPGQFKPSPCHRFLKRLEDSKKLLRNYTQNIDTLEQVAGIENVIECHGSFATASCTNCKSKVTSESIRIDILEQKIPYCAKCYEHSRQTNSGPDSLSDLYSQGIMKPDIVFFGEGLPDAFHEAMAKDKDKCDLLIVVGSSLKVRPVALIPSSIPAEVPQILINREPLPHLSFDVELLGDCDVIVNQLCHLMDDDWRTQCWLNPLGEVSELEEKAEIANQWATREDFALPGTSTDNRAEEIVQPVPKDRHFSTDSMLSAGDSGISGGTSSESPTCSEVSSGRDSRQCSTESMRSASCDEAHVSPSRHMSVDSMGSPAPVPSTSAQADDLDVGARWQPKSRESLADKLPDNSFYFQPPNRYIFPGAEVYLEPDYDSFSSSGSSANSEEEEGGEEEDAKAEQPPVENTNLP